MVFLKISFVVYCIFVSNVEGQPQWFKRETNDLTNARESTQVAAEGVGLLNPTVAPSTMSTSLLDTLYGSVSSCCSKNENHHSLLETDHENTWIKNSETDDPIVLQFGGLPTAVPILDHSSYQEFKQRRYVKNNKPVEDLSVESNIKPSKTDCSKGKTKSKNSAKEKKHVDNDNKHKSQENHTESTSFIDKSSSHVKKTTLAPVYTPPSTSQENNIINIQSNKDNEKINKQNVEINRNLAPKKPPRSNKCRPDTWAGESSSFKLRRSKDSERGREPTEEGVFLTSHLNKLSINEEPVSRVHNSRPLSPRENKLGDENIFLKTSSTESLNFIDLDDPLDERCLNIFRSIFCRNPSEKEFKPFRQNLEALELLAANRSEETPLNDLNIQHEPELKIRESFELHSPDLPRMSELEFSPISTPSSPGVFEFEFPDISRSNSPRLHKPDSPRPHKPYSPRRHKPYSPRRHKPYSPRRHELESSRIPEYEFPSTSRPLSPRTRKIGLSNLFEISSSAVKRNHVIPPVPQITADDIRDYPLDDIEYEDFETPKLNNNKTRNNGYLERNILEI